MPRDDLAGLRGLAIALVVVFHVWFGRVSGGVDVFLVLSGFFFGGRLLRLCSNGAAGFSVAREVTRLARRLLPALVVVVAASAVLTLLLQPRTRWETFADQSLSTFAYVQNWQLARSAGAYAAAGEAVSPLQHLWSMSVQGQFFLAVILVTGSIWALVAARGRRAWFVGVVTVATVCSFAYALVAHDADPTAAYYDSFARAWELLAGALAAVFVAHVHWPAWLRTVAGAVGLLAILSVGTFVDGAQEFPGPLALIPVGATILIICSGANLGAGSAAPWHNRLLAAAPLMTLGAIAYALYLWHWPLLIFWLTHKEDDSAGLSDGLVIVAVSAVLAYLTYRWVEQPVRTADSASPRRALPLVMGAAVALLAVAVAVGSVAWRQHTNAIRANGAELLTLSPIDYPGARALLDGLRVAKLPMRPTVLEAADDIPATTLDGCISDFGNSAVVPCVYGDPRAKRTIAVAGGSHAEHWMTALHTLGVRHGFKVVTYLKMGCPMTTDEEPRIPVSDEPYPGCRDWVLAALDALRTERPDFVFTTTTRPLPDSPGDHVPDSYVGIWDALAGAGLPILGIRDTPWMYRDAMMFSPVDCLADGGDPESCGLPRSEALADYNPTQDYLDRYPGLLPLDLSDAVCGPDVCRAVEGNVLVYHDAHHLSATYVRTLTDELGRQIAEATSWW